MSEAGRDALRQMERDALAILAMRDGAGPWPVPWPRPGFAARVATVRGHLAPIRDPHLLAESMAREAHLLGRRAAARPGPVRTAYALCLLELAGG